MLPENRMTDAGEIIQVAFEEVHPGTCNYYMDHPSIQKFLDETSLDPLTPDKRKRIDYRGSHANDLELVHTKTWFGRGSVRCSDLEQVAEIFRSD